MNRSHVLGIDILRFIAAVFVFIFHIGVLDLTPWDPHLPSHFDMSVVRLALADVAKYGWIGVEIFFVISGYAIAFSTTNRDRLTYAKSRILRLWPTVWICATICAVISLWSTKASALLIAKAWMGSMVISPVGPWIDGVYWTLPIEIAFYLLVGVVAVGRGLNRLDRLALVLALMSIAFWGLYAATIVLPAVHDLNQVGIRLANSLRFDLLLFHHGVYFAAGMFIHRPPPKSVVVWLAPLMVVAAYLEIDHSARQMSAYLQGMPVSGLVSALIWLSAMFFLAASIRWNEVIYRLISTKGGGAIKSIGSMTYPLYLLHVPVAFGAIGVAQHLGLSAWPAWWVGLITTLVIAAAVAIYLEPPLRAMCGRLIDWMLVVIRRRRQSWRLFRH